VDIATLLAGISSLLYMLATTAVVALGAVAALLAILHLSRQVWGSMSPRWMQ
jgi:hypothetical protein